MRTYFLQVIFTPTKLDKRRKVYIYPPLGYLRLYENMMTEELTITLESIDDHKLEHFAQLAASEIEK
jgi:hypothetical protein